MQLFVLRGWGLEPTLKILSALLFPAITHTLVPAAPTSLAVDATSSTTISVKWAASTDDGGSPITGYVVEYHGVAESEPHFETQVFPSNVLSATLDHLTPSTVYEVRVRVENAVGRSDPSVTMRAKTKVDGELNFQMVVEEPRQRLTDHLLELD